jgi:hypothetical protein
MRKKLEEDLKIITLRMGNVILSIHLATPQFSFLDLGREGAGGRAFPHPEQGTYPLW